MTNFLTKVAQMSGDFLGFFGKHHYLSKNCSSHFLGNFVKTLTAFLVYHLVTQLAGRPTSKTIVCILNDVEINISSKFWYKKSQSVISVETTIT